MSYRPSFSSESFRNRSSRKNEVDADGWEHVGSRGPAPSYTPAASTAASATNKWGQSALRKPVATPPGPKPFEEQFPTLGGGSKATPKPPTPPPGGGGAAAAAASAAAGLSFADLMKKRLADEEEERQRREMQAQREAEEIEREQMLMHGVIPIHSLVRARIARRFEDGDKYHDYAEDAEGIDPHQHIDYDSAYDNDEWDESA